MRAISISTKRLLGREDIAKRAARDLQSGWIVNLGIGMPTSTAKHINDTQDIIFHSENGIIGMGPPPILQEEDQDLRDAGDNPTTLMDGAAIVNHADSFAVARSGFLDCAILGAFQVASNGDLANWRLPQNLGGNIGGAMDIATGAKRVFAMMTHLTKDSRPKLVESLTYPVTALSCVTKIFTDMAVISVTEEGFRLDERAPGLTVADIQAATDASLTIAETLCEITL